MLETLIFILRSGDKSDLTFDDHVRSAHSPRLADFFHPSEKFIEIIIAENDEFKFFVYGRKIITNC